MTRPFGPEPEDFADVHEAAEAAASVRFQPTPEDAHVCPACYHPPHVGMCAICLCFKAVPASLADAEDDADAREDAQAVDDPVDSEPAAPKRGKHLGRRKITRSVVLSRLKMVRWRR